MSRPTVSFNSNDFASSVNGLVVVATNPFTLPTRVTNISALGSSNKSVMSSAYFTLKPLTTRVEIGQNSRDLLEASIDQLKSIIQAREATLIFLQGLANRQYTATLDSLSVVDTQGGWAAIDVSFKAADPYGYDTASTSLGSSRTTGSTRTNSFTIGGTAEWQLPVITVTLNSLTGGTTKSLIIGNPATGQQITVTRTWVAADVLVVDSQLRKVTVNGTEVAFSGAFPEFNTGTQSINYSDTLTTRDVTIATAYIKRYL